MDHCSSASLPYWTFDPDFNDLPGPAGRTPPRGRHRGLTRPDGRARPIAPRFQCRADRPEMGGDHEQNHTREDPVFSEPLLGGQR